MMALRTQRIGVIARNIIPNFVFSFPEILECDSSPCLNGGKCIEGSFGSGVGSGLDTTESAYTCECQPGFTGRNCETSKDSFI